jgi:hypothetical protein
MKLLFATACNVVLTDAEWGHSLIGVFDTIKIQVPAATEFPPNALLPREWVVFSKWQLETEDAGHNYVLICDITLPDGTLFANYHLAAPKPTENQTIAFVVRNPGLPMGQNGRIKAVMHLEEGKKVASENVEVSVGVLVERTLTKQ